MAKAVLPAGFLGTAMSTLTVKEPPMDSLYPGSSSGVAPSIIQVKVQWKHILLHVTQKLDVSDKVYSREDTMDAAFQSRMSFTLPLNKSERTFKVIDVIGGKCLTLPEAESEASAIALQELQHGSVSVRILDVSRMHFRKLGEKCEQALADGNEVYHLAKSLLSDWEDDMNKAEQCYSPDRHRVLENIHHGVYKPHGDMSPDVAAHLANMTKAYYLKLHNLLSETEKMKSYLDKVRGHAEFIFHEPSAHQVNVYRGSLPQEVKVDMKLVLQEMLNSLGWARPVFSVICSAVNLYLCKTSLFCSDVHTNQPVLILAINGTEASCEEEAIENSYKAVISTLEIEKHVHLLDLNYSDRSHGELYIVQAKETVQSIYLVALEVLVQWEAMVDEIRVCEEYCQKTTPGYPEGGEDSFLDIMKWHTIGAVAGFHKACMANQQVGKNRLKNISTCIREQRRN